MFGCACRRIRAKASGFVQSWGCHAIRIYSSSSSFIQRRERLRGVVETAVRGVRETTYLEQIVHHTEEVGFAIEVVSRNVWLILSDVVSATMSESQRMPKLMHQ